jgi:hypothetical protein
MTGPNLMGYVLFQCGIFLPDELLLPQLITGAAE